MSLRGFKAFVVCTLAAAAGVSLVSCGHSPTTPAGLVLVHVVENGVTPVAGKRVEIPGTMLRDVTDEAGNALFSVRPGTYVVRVYDLGTPGPSRPYVEQTVEVESARESRAEFNDCTVCR